MKKGGLLLLTLGIILLIFNLVFFFRHGYLSFIFSFSGWTSVLLWGWVLLTLLFLIIFALSIFRWHFAFISNPWLINLFLTIYLSLNIWIVISNLVSLPPFNLKNQSLKKVTNSCQTFIQERLAECDNVYLNFKVIDYPREIHSMCQKVIFKLEATNIGSNDLKYDDFLPQGDKDPKFNFSIDGDKVGAGGTNDIYRVKDFGVIHPGETKIIELYNKTPGNGFDSFPKGKQKVHINTLNGPLREYQGQMMYPCCGNCCSERKDLNTFEILIGPEVDTPEDYERCFAT